MELSGLDLGCRFDVFDYGPADRLYVCSDASGLCAFDLELFPGHVALHLDVLLHRAIHEPLLAYDWKHGSVLHSVWCFHHYHCLRRDALCQWPALPVGLRCVEKLR